MKRSKSQAVYKFLPRTWISERDDNGVAVTAQITHWSYKEMKGEMLTYDRTCNIGGKAARRGKVQEYIFTNIPGVKREEAEE